MSYYIKIIENIVVEVIENKNNINIANKGTYMLFDKKIMVGSKYEPKENNFIPPKPFESWVWDKDKKEYLPPFPKPNDNKVYDWNEKKQKWEYTGYYFINDGEFIMKE